MEAQEKNGVLVESLGPGSAVGTLKQTCVCGRDRKQRRGYVALAFLAVQVHAEGTPRLSRLCWEAGPRGGARQRNERSLLGWSEHCTLVQPWV